MRRNDLSKYREQFNRAVDQAIKECSRATGVTDVDSVDRHLKKSASVLFKRISILLAEEQRRNLIQKRLKRCTVSVQEADAEAQHDAEQVAFDFFKQEEFRGVPKRITYPEGKLMLYVEYNRSHEWQRELSIAHLGKGIDADVARRDAEIAGNNRLRPLVRQFGDLPAEELVRRQIEDRSETA